MHTFGYKSFLFGEPKLVRWKCLFFSNKRNGQWTKINEKQDRRYSDPKARNG